MFWWSPPHIHIHTYFSQVSCISLNLDRSLLASGQTGSPAVVRVWECASGKCLALFQTHHRGLHSLRYIEHIEVNNNFLLSETINRPGPMRLTAHRVKWDHGSTSCGHTNSWKWATKILGLLPYLCTKNENMAPLHVAIERELPNMRSSVPWLYMTRPTNKADVVLFSQNLARHTIFLFFHFFSSWKAFPLLAPSCVVWVRGVVARHRWWSGRPHDWEALGRWRYWPRPTQKSA